MTHRRGSGRYANCPRERGRHDCAGEAVRSSSWDGLGEDATKLSAGVRPYAHGRGAGVELSGSQFRVRAQTRVLLHVYREVSWPCVAADIQIHWLTAPLALLVGTVALQTTSSRPAV